MRLFILAAAILAVFLLSACTQEHADEKKVSGENDQSITVDPAPGSPQPTPKPLSEAPAPPAAGAAGGKAVEPENNTGATEEEALDPVHEKLLGSRWLVDDVEVSILDKDTVFMKGGKAAEIATGGFKTTYRYADGVIEVRVMGMTLAGTWDGANLVIDGNKAIRLDGNEAGRSE